MVEDSIVVDGTSLCDGDDAGARPADTARIALPATEHCPSIALPATQQLRGADYPLPTTSPQLRGAQRTCVLAERTGWGETILGHFESYD